MATNIFPVSATFPPNVMPEEILSDHPERLRAALVSASNPLRSYADTTAYEQAFKRLDLLVTSELAMTETGVLPTMCFRPGPVMNPGTGSFLP
jgi:anaerobic selenocysteine-containing dehydrogenase